MDPRPTRLIRSVRLTNYRSIAACDVALDPLTVLVGPNGAGKSNFLDALAFVAEAVSTTPDQALVSRGGLGEVLCRVPRQAASLSVHLDVAVPTDQGTAAGAYEFELVRETRPGTRTFRVGWEACILTSQGRTVRFQVRDGEIIDPDLPELPLRIEPDRLYLPTAGARPAFAPLFNALRRMYFYAPDLATLRRPEPEAAGASLGPRGEHLGDVLGAMDPAYKERFDSYMAAVVPDLISVDRRYELNYVSVELRTRADGDAVFGADAMSDGTIRAAGLLAALFQPGVVEGLTPLIGIEEPELALHPGAAGALFDALTETSERVQILATSQSAELFDREDVDPALVRVVTSNHGHTVIGRIDPVSRGILADRRLTLGELMRANQLMPDAEGGAKASPSSGWPGGTRRRSTNSSATLPCC